jgi:2-polyprenyl-3-methyl-5-hydroxy-6-metoxy-1,4-benzoquinol methylase
MYSELVHQPAHARSEGDQKTREHQREEQFNDVAGTESEESHYHERLVESYALEDQRRMSAAKNYFAWQARLVLPHLGRRVLEVGCGIGNFTGNLLDRELVVAIDSDPDGIAHLSNRYINCSNLHALVVEAGQVKSLAAFEFDSAVCLNVLEHIADDVQVLREIAQTLKPGGVLVLLVPAFSTLTGPIDRNLGHFRRYSRSLLMRRAIDTGFAIRGIRYVNAAGFFGWWWNARVLRREAQSTVQIAFFDRFVVPVASRVEAFVHPPFGQSILAVMVVR